nr:unnamed protein product [Digitaria exilis]
MRSSAQVSDANTTAPLGRRPITRGRKPNGSRTAKTLSAVRNSSEYAPLRRSQASQMRESSGRDSEVAMRCRITSVSDELVAQRLVVHEVAVVRHGELPEPVRGEERLHVAHRGGAGRGVPHVPDGSVAGELCEARRVAEDVPDEAQPRHRLELAIGVRGGDARALLPAQSDDASGSPMTPNTPHSSRGWSSPSASKENGVMRSGSRARAGAARAARCRSSSDDGLGEHLSW